MKRHNRIPNLITLFRLLTIPFVLYFILVDKIYIAVTLFAISALSDKLDGEFARRLKQTSYWGGWFDAFTDSILILSTILFGYLTNHITLKLLIILFLPKIISYLFLLFLYDGKYKATIFSRWSSVIFYILIPVFLLDIHQLVIYILIFVIYILSLINWVKLFRLKST